MKHFVTIEKRFYDKLHDETARSPNLNPGNVGTNTSYIASQSYHSGGVTLSQWVCFLTVRKMDRKSLYPQKNCGQV